MQDARVRQTQAGIQATAEATDSRYVAYLVVMALGGWALASYDLNLLVLALPDIARDLQLSERLVGLLGFIVFVAQFVITLFVGWGMDRFGRRVAWMVCLSGSAIFTGLTYFVQDYTQLAIVRALASGLAFSELAVSITIVNEQVPARWRGLLYSVVQGGWPLGVFLASGVYLLFSGYGWRFVFLLGVLPILMVLLGRLFIRESERFTHLAAVRAAHERGDNAEVRSLRERHEVAVDELGRFTVSQLFATPGPIRKQTVALTIVWLFYAFSYVPTNFYIAYWLTQFKGFSEQEAGTLLLVCGGIGFFFYLLGGWIGERIGRRGVLIATGILVAPLNLVFLFVADHTVLVIVYFLIYQVTNGTWSGAGYAYQGESFPTRVRGTAIGFLGAMQVLGFILGTAAWTLLIGVAGPTATWVIIAVIGALGLWTTLLLQPIPPGQELEEIAS